MDTPLEALSKTKRKFRQYSPNRAEKRGDYVYVYIKGKSAVVDAENYGLVKDYRLHLNSHGYACRNIGGRYGVIQMHHVILGFPESGLEVDHINGVPSDNRRSNLRFCDRHQNVLNRNFPRGKTGLLGVYPSSKYGYIAMANVYGVSKYFGFFKDKIDAALARDRGVRSLLSEKDLCFAKFNF